MIYLVIFIGLLFLSYMYDYRRHIKGYRACLLIVLLVLILLGGLRYRLGTDTVNYMYDYAHIPPIDKMWSGYLSVTRYAPGYVFLTSLCRYLTKDFVIVQMIHSVFLNTVVVWFLYKNSRNTFFALLLYYSLCYSLLAFQQMRESFAVGFFLLAWPSFRDGKWLKWYALSVCAMLFHVSATVMLLLPVFILPGIRNLFVMGRRVWIVGLAVLASGIILQAVFFKYIQLIAMSEAVADRAAVYSTTQFASGLWNIGGISGVIYTAVRYVVFPLVALYSIIRLRKLRHSQDNSEGFDRSEFMVIMSVYIGLFSFGISIWTRYNNYFYFFPVIVISDWIYSMFPVGVRWLRLNALYWWMLCMPLLGLHFYYSYMGNVNKSGTLKSYMSYYPYSSWIDMKKDSDRENCYSYQKTLGH